MSQKPIWLGKNTVALRGAELLSTGVVIDKPTSMTVGEDSMLGQANMLNWEVQKRPLVNEYGHVHTDKFEVTYMNPDTEQREVFPNVIVGRHYIPYQNEEFFRFADALLNFDAIPQLVGTAVDRRRVFGTFKIEGSINVGGVDLLEPWLLAKTSHDGTLRMSIDFKLRRLKCTNELGGIGLSDNAVVIKHTASADYNMAKARETLGLAKTWITEVNEIAEKLVNVPMKNDQFVRMAETIYPKPLVTIDAPNKGSVSKWESRIDNLEKIFLGDGSQGDTTGKIGNTAWCGYNALIEEVDWYRVKPDRSNALAMSQQSLGIIGHTSKTKNNILTQVEHFVNTLPKTVALS